MQVNRRGAIYLLTGGTISLMSGCWPFGNKPKPPVPSPPPVAPGNSQPNTVGYKLRGTLVAYASTYNLENQPDSQTKTVQALIQLAHQRQNLDSGRKNPEQAADEVRSATASQRPLDPDTFDSTLALYTPQESDLSEGIDFARVLSAGTYAGLSMIAVPEGVAAVMLLGALAAATDIGISRLPEILTSFALPPMQDDQLSAVNLWTVKQSASLVDSSSSAKQAAADLFADGTISVDLNQTPEAAVAQLPAQVQAVAGPNISTDPSAPPANAEDSIKQALQDGFDSLSKSSDKTIQLLTAEKNLYVKAMLESQQQNDVRSTAADITAIGVIGGGILNLFGNPSMARKVNGLATVGAQIYTTLASSGLGALTIAGNLFSAANTLFSLFGGASDPMLAALQPIYTMLNQISQQLNLIAIQQKQILTALAQIYQVELENHEMLLTVKGDLKTFATDSSESAVATERVLFDNSKNELATMLTNNTSVSIGGDVNLKQTYDSRVTDCYTFASVTARSNAQASNIATILDNAGMGALIRSRGRCDRLVGLLPTIGFSLGLQQPAATGDLAAGPVCPTAWAEGVDCYLEARCRAASLGSRAETAQSQTMWTDGQYLRMLIACISSLDALQAVRKQLRNAAGFPDGELTQISDISGSNLLHTVYSAASLCVSQNVISTMVVREGYGPAWGVPNGSVVVEPDYFQSLLDRQLVSLENCTQHPGYNPGFNDCNVRIVADGPYKQSLLVPDKVMATRPYEYAGGVGAIEAKSRWLWRGVVERPQVQANMPADLTQALAAENFPEFEYWGEVVRLIGTFVNWRVARQHSIEAMLLQNINGPFSSQEVAEMLGAYVKTGLSFSGDWAFEVAQALGGMLDDAIESIRIQAASIPPNKCPVIVDDTLRRLTGYMLARGIPFPSVNARK